jgi:phage repressor protein C with HTH and peptisase S24 domain
MAKEARAELERLIVERGEDYAGLSRLIGRNAAYVQQYIKRGVPMRLAEEDRRRLADYFGVSEALLGGPAPAAGERDTVTVPRLDVGAAAGSGAFAEAERRQGHFAFSAAWLRRLAAGDPASLSIIRVEGHSMYPLLAHRDEILVDRSDGAARLRDGVYVLRRDDALIVKRLALNPSTGRVSIRSDNEDYPSWPECDPATLDIVGRVIWSGRVIG